MDPATPSDDRTEAEAVLAATHEAAASAFGARLLATLAIGSLGHGGFSPLVSDVDVALLIADPLEPSDAELADTITTTIRSEGGLAARLSLFWTSPAVLAGHTTGGRLPALDRLDLARHARVLHGAFDPAPIALPTTDQLVIEAVEFALEKLATPEVTAELHDPDRIVAQGARHLTKRVLFPVRFLYTAATGGIGTNEDAVAWYATSGHPAPDLVATAFGWRTGPVDPEQALALLETGLLPIYDAFVATHVPRMTDLGRPDLADALATWRQALARPDRSVA